MSLRLKKRGEKGLSSPYFQLSLILTDCIHVALERALNGTVEEGSQSAKGKWKGPEEETINEDEEPLTPAPGKTFGSQLHRRETAEVGDD